MKASFFASRLNLTHVLGRAKQAHGLSGSWAESSTGFWDSCRGSFVTSWAQTCCNATMCDMITMLPCTGGPELCSSPCIRHRPYCFWSCTLYQMVLHLSCVCQRKNLCLRAEETLTTWHSLNANFLPLLFFTPSLKGCRKKWVPCATQFAKEQLFLCSRTKNKNGWL